MTDVEQNRTGLLQHNDDCRTDYRAVVVSGGSSGNIKTHHHPQICISRAMAVKLVRYKSSVLVFLVRIMGIMIF